MEKYISLERSFELIQKESDFPHIKRVKLADSLNKQVAGNISATQNIPAFDKSAMDGYAVNLDLNHIEKPVSFKVKKIIEAGDSAEVQLRPNESVKIMTGAPVPKDAVAVIMKEKVEITGNDTIRTSHIPQAGENIIISGEDCKKGEILIPQCTTLRPSHIALLANQGIQEIDVIKQPNIGILSTGSEIVDLTNRPGPNQLRNSNSHMLKSLLERDKIDATDLGIARDEVTILQQTIQTAFEQFDLLITTGGVSAGDKDLIISVIERLGFTGIFHQVMIKPGRPVFFAKNNEQAIIALPGNPVSAYLGYLLFIRKYLFGTIQFVPVKLGFEFHNRSDLSRFVPVRITSDERLMTPNSCNISFEKVKYNGSSDMVGLSKATHFLIFDKQTSYKPGDIVNSLQI